MGTALSLPTDRSAHTTVADRPLGWLIEFGARAEQSHLVINLTW